MINYSQFKIINMRLKRMFMITAILLVVFMVGCKKDNPVVHPSVTSTYPVRNDTSIVLDANITAIFSTPMQPSTITATSFTLTKGTASVSGVVSYSDLTATFNPNDKLDPSTVYMGTVTIEAKDLAGNPMNANYIFSFTSGRVPDVTPPVVASTSPVNSVTGVATNKVVTFTFSEAMDPATINTTTFTLKQGTTVVPGVVTYSGLVATFTPSANLDYSKVYTATITTGAKDKAGNAITANVTFSFTTGVAPDITAPTVLSVDPLNSATGVALNKHVALTFSEAMNPSTINATTFTLKQGTAAIWGTVTYSGVVATFTPVNSLGYSTVYTVVITTGAKDLAGNALVSNNTFTFTTVASTDVTPPTVLSTNPLDNATAVVLNHVVSVNFSEAMDPSTLTASTFTLKQGTTSVSGSVAYVGTIATFTTTNVLLASTVYTATVTTGAKDLAGNALVSSTVWSFTTGSDPAGLAVVNLGTAGNYVILAKTAINNSPTSAITGDLGLSPAATSYITGFGLTDATGYATTPQVTGKVFAADMVTPTSDNLTTAVENMITAYNDAAGRPFPDFLELGTGNIGGLTLTKGLYKWTSTVTLPSDVTISGGANDVFIFQISGDLSVSNAVKVTLSGGVQAKNIFWQVAGQVTIGTTAHFEGIILSWAGITFQTGASFKGRALAETAVILDSNTVVGP
jgi:Ice-binding-like/Bacterial Ig-like domain